MTEKDNVKVVVVVRFKSRLPDDELHRRYTERMPEFRRLPGLVQKYYFRDPATGEWGGVYAWASEADMQTYMASDLRKSIATVYEVEGAPRLEVLPVIDRLRG